MVQLDNEYYVEGYGLPYFIPWTRGMQDGVKLEFQSKIKNWQKHKSPFC